MIRRHFLNLVFGVAAGVAVFAATANLRRRRYRPISAAQSLVLPAVDARRRRSPAVIGQDEVNRLKPEQVRWHHHHWRHHHCTIGIITTGTTAIGITGIIGITTTGIITTGTTIIGTTTTGKSSRTGYRC